MRLPYELVQREALAAPTAKAQMYIQDIVILVVSLLSITGAGWIILSFVCFKSLRSFRHKLILGLAISDFVMAVNFLSSTAMDLSGRYIGAPDQATFCSFNGFMTQVFVIQTDYWVLTISVCTYFILAGHKELSCWIQDYVIVLYCLPWIFSTLWAVVGLRVAGYGDIGAWCWFTSDKVRLLANFVPRWTIIFAILIMYARVYFVLRNTERSLLNFRNLSSGPTSGSRTNQGAAHSDQQSNATGNRNTHVEASGNDLSDRATRKLKRIARLMLMYPIAYMLVWALPTAIRIYQATRDTPAPFGLQTVDKACIVVQGLVDAVIYGLNEASLSRWRDYLFPNSFPIINGTGDSQPGSAHHGGRRSMRSSHVDDAISIDSTSSLEVIPSTANSVTRIVRSSKGMDGKNLVQDQGIELSRMNELTGYHGGDSLKGIVIEKRIEVSVSNKVDGTENSWGEIDHKIFSTNTTRQ